MKIGFVVNDVATEKASYATTALALTAARMGHEAGLIGLGDLSYLPDGSVAALVRSGGDKAHRSHERYLADVQADEGTLQQLGDFDVLMLRFDPANESERPWAPAAGLAFGQLAAAQGVLVVNDPEVLSTALSKAYFQHFPEAVRPRTLISRDVAQVRGFVTELGGRAVLKPLQGSGGSGVFMVNDSESANLNQIVEAITRDGYCVTQEYLPAAAQGDTRLLLLNGRPLEVDGTYAALRRVNASDDIRSNLSAGGSVQQVEVTDEMLAVAELVRPKLVADGMYLVGLDIVGDKLMEVNVFSPGGLGAGQNPYDLDFTPAVIEDLERKVRLHGHYPQALDNRGFAAL